MKLQQIIVVDDSDADLLYTRIILERAEVADSVLTFGTGMEALDFLQQPEGHEVDVILLDINMPEMSGFEFLQAYERLHESQRARAVVVMLTSSPDPGDKQRAFGFGCVRHYVVKPLQLAQARELPAMIQTLRSVV